VFLLAFGLYFVNKWVFKPLTLSHPGFFHCYFNDLICIPFWLPPILFIHRKLGIRDHDGPPDPLRAIRLSRGLVGLLRGDRAAASPIFPEDRRRSVGLCRLLGGRAGVRDVVGHILLQAQERRRAMTNDSDNTTIIPSQQSMNKWARAAYLLPLVGPLRHFT